jgi:protein-disulfide isomerase
MRPTIFGAFFEADMAKILSKTAFAALAAFTTLGAASIVAAQAKPAWLTTFTVSDKGGHIIGNPAAPTKIVEYASYTCGHCGEFEVKEAPLLKSQYVANGKASFEIRNLVRDPLDLTAAVLARCGGKGRFFGNHKQLMATQAQWADGRKLSKATIAKLEAKQTVAFMQAAYVELGLNKIMAARGVTAAQAKTCLADATAFSKVIAMTDEATGPLGMNSTPSFMINGKVVDASHWAELQTLLPK